MHSTKSFDSTILLKILAGTSTLTLMEKRNKRLAIIANKLYDHYVSMAQRWVQRPICCTTRRYNRTNTTNIPTSFMSSALLTSLLLFSYDGFAWFLYPCYYLSIHKSESKKCTLCALQFQCLVKKCPHLRTLINFRLDYTSERQGCRMSKYPLPSSGTLNRNSLVQQLSPLPERSYTRPTIQQKIFGYRIFRPTRQRSYLTLLAVTVSQLFNVHKSKRR